MNDKEPVYWLSQVKELDDFGNKIWFDFVDGQHRWSKGQWAIMAWPNSYDENGIGELGLGLGQRYHKQVDGKWIKVEG